MALPGLRLRPLDAVDDDRIWAASFLDDHLGGRLQARRGELVDVLEGDGLVAALGDDRVGLVTWLAGPDGRSAEIRAVAVDSVARGRGIGHGLFEAAHAALARAGIRSVWLVTTNDNLPAIRLYESLGYGLVEVRSGAIDEIRRTIKPSIPLVGQGGVEMHDELEMTKGL